MDLFTAHDSAMADLKAARAPQAITQQERGHYGVELAKLVVQLCERGALKSTKRLEMVKTLLKA